MVKVINKAKGYSSINRDLVFDKAISDRARFLYVYMACKPETWEFFQDNMCGELGYGKDTLRKYLDELITAGWITEDKQQHEADGKFGSLQYTIEVVKNRNGKNPIRKNTDSEKYRNGKNPNHINIENKEIKNKEENNNSLTHIACAERNYLQEEYYKLMDDLSWKEVICMNYHLTMDELRKTLIHFFLDCKCAGTIQHQNEQDAKSHFNSWLKKNKNGNNSTNILKQQKRGKTLDEFIEDSIAELHRSKPEV